MPILRPDIADKSLNVLILVPFTPKSASLGVFAIGDSDEGRNADSEGEGSMQQELHNPLKLLLWNAIWLQTIQ